MAVYKDYTVPVPEEGVIFHNDGRCKATRVEYTLKVRYDKTRKIVIPTRLCIGHLIDHDRTKMHPTSNYQKVFPKEWEEISGETVNPSTVHIGLFSFARALQNKYGIFDMLARSLGEEEAKPTLDYALYSLFRKSDVTAAFSEAMKDEMLFRDKPYKDSSYSTLFSHRITEDQINAFKKEWALFCKKMGVEEVWLYLDGSNVDCKSKGVEIAEPGKSKSGKNVNIISFTCAVAQNGMPVTFEIYRGSMVDAKAMKKILDFLRECGIKVAGVILDRGYCTTDSIRYLQENDIDYIIMCKSNPAGYKRMEAACGNEIKNNILYWVWFTDLFATQKYTQIFDSLDKKDYLTLFYDPVNGAERTRAALRKLSSEMKKDIQRLQYGKEVTIPVELKDWLEYKKNEYGIWQPVLKTEIIQKALDEKGLYGIISSKPMDPYTVHKLYSSRSVVEVYFHQTKTEIGYKALRAHITNGVRSKFFIGFLTSILRWFIQMAVESEDPDLDTNRMIEELRNVRAIKINNAYLYSHTAQEKVKKFFREFDEDAEKLFTETVKIMNDREDGIVWKPRERKRGPKKGSHNKKYDEQGNEIKTEVKKERKKPGLPKGYKMGPVNKDGTERKKPGVPKGFKRGTYNKDGSLRKKPGPKSATASAGV